MGLEVMVWGTSEEFQLSLGCSKFAKTTAPHRPGNTTHQGTTARAPQEPCWQELHSTPVSPAGKTPASTRIHRRSTTRALHHFLLARTQARTHGFHSNRAPSSMLARTPASTRFITAAAPHQPCRQEFQPVLGTTRASLFHDSPQPHHCWQELTPVHHLCQELHPALCSPSMQHQNAPSAGKELQPTLDAPHQPC